MAGGYFDLPTSSRRSSASSTSTGSSRIFPGTREFPTTFLSERYPPGKQQQTKKERGSNDAWSAQGKHRNAGILRSTNRVKFTVGGDGSPEVIGGSTIEPRVDRRDVVLPQKPSPTASIPYNLDMDAQLAPLAENGASTDVTGLKISSQTSLAGIVGDDEINNPGINDKGRAIYLARERLQRPASLLSCPPKSPKPSPRSSLASLANFFPTEVVFPVEDGDDIPMISFSEKQQLYDDLTDDEAGSIDGRSTPHTSEAHQIVRQMTRSDFNFLARVRAPSPGLFSGQVTPVEERDPDIYVERPKHYRGGILSSLLKLYDQQASGNSKSKSKMDPYYPQGRYGRSRQGSSSEFSGRTLSPDSVWKPHRPRKWYEKSRSQSSTSLSGSTAKSSISSPISMLKRSRSSSAITNLTRRMVKSKLEDEIRITVHIAELLSRQRYLIRLCRALMKYGAPTHRLEEYMRMTARVLEIEGQFLYIPGCMIISFDDASTHTTEVKVVRSTQGIDLGKLADVHEIYKEVIHDVIGVEEAIQRLDEVTKKSSKFHILFLIFAHGCASASVGPFAFNARPIDMPIAFLLGCLLGVLQLVLSPKSSLYSNVFEISAAVLTSFLARAFGSIRYNGEPLFCFSALAQSAIALILPGYTVLCASLELQSRSIVAGSVRMVYAIIYSLFLGFGITIGTAVYGLLDSQASTSYNCAPSPINNEYLQRFPFVLMFTACLAIVNRAKWKQIPMMMVISLAGYVVSYFSSKRFYSNTQVSNALGAFVIGVIGNFYSRLRHGLAAAAMLPAIFVLVPSGLAASGSLISGITSAEEMTRSPYSVVNNGTQGFVDAAKNLSAAEARNQSYGVVFDIGYGMVQVAIGTTVGLFLAALVVYPLGKKRSGLFSF
ncbi:hypothetical protein N7474_003706 [Penicillium riverlandense]|uniref:uncharacterized protein n=1 Tax=Penicillium riverlandense TaxID=1903569 RepID=UPI00254975B4|nr:uncharacterized protein N7474_003706 [Penicillium riverlandense]KAJ5818115.1 hypothetical protein N7474_003706 [Penicillium riverlandense]